MHTKQTNIQQVLQGLLDRDFEQIGTAARTLKHTSLDAPELQSDDELDDRVYEHFELEFVRLAGKLEQMAERENAEGAAYVYQNLTSTCIACHEHIRRPAPANLDETVEAASAP